MSQALVCSSSPQGLVLFLVFAVMMIMMIDYGGGVMVPY